MMHFDTMEPRKFGIILCTVLLIITFWFWIDLLGAFKTMAIALIISSFIITYSLINWSD